MLSENFFCDRANSLNLQHWKLGSVNGDATTSSSTALPKIVAAGDRTMIYPMGSDDELGFAKSTTAFARLLDELKPKGLDYRFMLYPGEKHNSVRLVAFPAGLYLLGLPPSQVNVPSVAGE